MENIKSLIRTIPDWPKPGIQFRDITTLLKDPDGWRQTIAALTERYRDRPIDAVAGVESRGFIIGAPLAYNLGVGFLPVRKPGKLPAETVSQSYELEYGSDQVEMHVDAVADGARILLVDDLIATGGTIEAAAKLIESQGGVIAEIAFVIELTDLRGRDRLKSYNVYSMVTFAGD